MRLATQLMKTGMHHSSKMRTSKAIGGSTTIVYCPTQKPDEQKKKVLFQSDGCLRSPSQRHPFKFSQYTTAPFVPTPNKQWFTTTTNSTAIHCRSWKILRLFQLTLKKKWKDIPRSTQQDRKNKKVAPCLVKFWEYRDFVKERLCPTGERNPNCQQDTRYRYRDKIVATLRKAWKQYAAENRLDVKTGYPKRDMNSERAPRASPSGQYHDPRYGDTHPNHVGARIDDTSAQITSLTKSGDVSNSTINVSIVRKKSRRRRHEAQESSDDDSDDMYHTPRKKRKPNPGDQATFYGHNNWNAYTPTPYNTGAYGQYSPAQLLPYGHPPPSMQQPQYTQYDPHAYGQHSPAQLPPYGYPPLAMQQPQYTQYNPHAYGQHSPAQLPPYGHPPPAMQQPQYTQYNPHAYGQHPPHSPAQLPPYGRPPPYRHPHHDPSASQEPDNQRVPPTGPPPYGQPPPFVHHPHHDPSSDNQIAPPTGPPPYGQPPPYVHHPHHDPSADNQRLHLATGGSEQPNQSVARGEQMNPTGLPPATGGIQQPNQSVAGYLRASTGATQQPNQSAAAGGQLKPPANGGMQQRMETKTMDNAAVPPQVTLPSDPLGSKIATLKRKHGGDWLKKRVCHIKEYQNTQKGWNSPLRLRTRQQTFTDKVSLMVELLEELDSYKGTVLRGVNLPQCKIDELKELGPGEIYSDPAFLSTTMNGNMGKFEARSCHFFITAKKKGKALCQVTILRRDEGEVLFPPNTKFLVTRIEEFPDNRHGRFVIHMEEIVD
eukprot:scaffold3576_cov170-Amphora_coffeaeformis.AAC.18